MRRWAYEELALEARLGTSSDDYRGVGSSGRSLRLQEDLSLSLSISLSVSLSVSGPEKPEVGRLRLGRRELAAIAVDQQREVEGISAGKQRAGV
ncbi:hypothetical protein M5K25_021884 [Dendrobium thyrsiflorum]|uniref:Uncharacterized protein n=1 Tax=Dendrobium thyrsiflorum TaxID=117978 RepID=A0ABD0U561_DENTH